MFRIRQSVMLLLMGVFLAPRPDGAAGELKFIALKPVSVLHGEEECGGGIMINDLCFPMPSFKRWHIGK